MENERVLIVGGSSGMGLALARRLLGAGAEVHIAGRSADRLAAAERSLGRRRSRQEGQPGSRQEGQPGSRQEGQPEGRQAGQPESWQEGRQGRLHTRVLDIGDEDGVRDVTAQPFDHVVVTAADVAGAYRPIGEFPLAAARAVLDTKLLGPWLVAKHAAPRLRAGGSLTFTSGIAAYRPGPGSSMLATANGALEALSRTLAVELAPVRVNVVSPGWVDTPIWDVLAGPAKGERLAAMAARLPAGRVGTPDDVAAVFHAVMTNGFVTGTVVHVDGGQRLV